MKHDNKYLMIGMSEEDMEKQNCVFFNERIKVGDRVVYYPSCDKRGLIIHRNGKRTYTRTRAVMHNKTPVVSLDGIGMVSIHHIENGESVKLDAKMFFDEKSKHEWPHTAEVEE